MDERASLRSVHQAREALYGSTVALEARPASVRPAVFESWRRARVQGLCPDRVTPRYDAEVDLDAYLARTADSIVARRVAALDHAACSLSLTDADGRVLRRWVPDAAFAARLDALCVMPGFAVEESSVGTTSAISLLSGEPVLVRGPEHFSENFVGLSCAGAPIIHPVTRRAIGSLNLTCTLQDTTPLVLSWVVDLAADVADAIGMAGSRREQLLLDAYLRENRDTRHPLVVLDEQTIITNAAAARLLSGLDQAMLWEHASRALGRGTGRPGDLLVNGAPHRVQCTPVLDGNDAIGAVLLVRGGPSRASSKSVPHSAPVLPGLVGQGPRWGALCRSVQRAGDGSVVLVGEAGSGRLAIARAMAGNAPVRVLDADDATLGPDRWLHEIEECPTGEVLILRHIDRLDGTLAAATANALSRHPQRRVLATSTVGSFEEGASGHLLEFFAAEIDVPPLRERLEDLPVLLAACTRRILPDGPSVHWMPDAVQALSRLEWSGNLTSLHAVVRRLVSRRTTTTYIGAADLPPELIARASRRKLARLEQAEAQTILHALRDAGGNKHQAAASLGIARSTLYRKVRALGLDLTKAAY